MVAVAAALAAAVLLGAGFVLQQSQASAEPAERSLRVGLLADLVRSPRWLAGMAAMVGGQLLGAVALARGGLALAEPLLSSNLLFALLIASAARRRLPSRRDLCGAVLLCGGLAGFLALASPGVGATGSVAPGDWAVCLGVVVGVAAALTTLGRRGSGRRRGAALAGAAGVLFGLQDALTQTSLDTAGHGAAAVAVSWPPYLLLATAVVGLLLAQSAFQAAALPTSLPPVTAGEPVTGIAVGVGVFGGSINDQPVALVAEAVCLAALLAGLWVLAASPTHAAAPDGDPRTPARSG